MRILIILSLFIVAFSACVTTESDTATEEMQSVLTFSKDSPDPVKKQVFFDLYYSLQAVIRAEAEKSGGLHEYHQEFDKTGRVSLSDESTKIVCDKPRCQVFLRNNAFEGNAMSVAGRLFRGLGLNGSTSSVKRSTGRKGASQITCIKESAQYQCIAVAKDAPTGDTNSEEAVVESDDVESCEKHPNITMKAEALAQEVALSKDPRLRGGLIKLYKSKDFGGSPGGYIRFSRTDPSTGTVGLDSIIFVDIHLCGAFSHNYFYVSDKSDRAKHWIGASPKAGSMIRGLEIADEGVKLKTVLTLMALEPTPALEMTFRLESDEKNVFGHGTLFFALPDLANGEK